jgi:hypothetical protein
MDTLPLTTGTDFLEYFSSLELMDIVKHREGISYPKKKTKHILGSGPAEDFLWRFTPTFRVSNFFSDRNYLIPSAEALTKNQWIAKANLQIALAEMTEDVEMLEKYKEMRRSPLKAPIAVVLEGGVPRIWDNREREDETRIAFLALDGIAIVPAIVGYPVEGKGLGLDRKPEQEITEELNLF